MCGVTVCDIALSVNCWYYIGARGVCFVRLAVGDCYGLHGSTVRGIVVWVGLFIAGGFSVWLQRLGCSRHTTGMSHLKIQLAYLRR